MIFPVEPGDLRHYVSYQTPTKTRDAVGQSVTTWATDGHHWAEVINLTGRELAYAQQIVANATHRVTLRYFGAISTDSRFLMEDGTTLNVDYIDKIKQVNAYVVCLCTTQE